jgi:cytochrome c oxidase assembly protein subunit 15
MERIGRSVSGSVAWPHYLAILTSGSTIVLIMAGGLVTSLGAGLAVPDWPTTFGYNMFLYPWAKMVGGIFYEHSHRLLGSLVGFLTILTAGAIWWKESRKWVFWLAAGAVGLVIVQGVLGGLRVVWLKLILAIIHACVAQLFLGLMIALAVFTSRSWVEAAPPADREGGLRLRRLSLVAVGLIYIQTIFGAILRHTGNRLDAHLLFAALVAVVVFLLATNIFQDGDRMKEIQRPAQAIGILLIVQIFLGAGSYLTKYTVLGDAVTPWTIALLTAAHVVTGALLFAASIVIALRLHWSLFVQRTPSPGGEMFTEQAPAS